MENVWYDVYDPVGYQTRKNMHIEKLVLEQIPDMELLNKAFHWVMGKAWTSDKKKDWDLAETLARVLQIAAETAEEK